MHELFQKKYENLFGFLSFIDIEMLQVVAEGKDIFVVCN